MFRAEVLTLDDMDLEGRFGEGGGGQYVLHGNRTFLVNPSIFCATIPLVALTASLHHARLHSLGGRAQRRVRGLFVRVPAGPYHRRQ